MRYTLDSMLPVGAFSPEIRSPLGSRMRLHGDGGGGGGPTTTTTNTSNIPDYLKDHVLGMLEAADNLIYTKDKDGKKTFRPFKPFSDDPSAYFAGPTGAQKAAYNQVMGLRSPYQYDSASRQADKAGRMGLGAKADYQRGATDPRSVAAYMSPYMQNAVDVQKQQAMKDFYGTQSPNLDAQAIKAGAFGGSRHGVAQAMAMQDLNRNLQNIQATGTDKAFDNAQKAQQFGANLGIQGAQLGNTAAQNLANIGKDQQASNLARIGMMDQLGGKQQAHQQAILNQQIQNFAMQQQYPYQQLSMLNNMIRGMPMQNTTTASYQAQPNVASQLAGLGAGVFGASKAFGSRKGGLIKGLAAGGPAPDTAAAASAVTARMPSAEIQGDLKKMSTEYLEMLNQRLPAGTPLKGQVEAELMSRQRTTLMSKMAPQGVDQMPSGLPQMKDGGIVGYAGGKKVEEEENEYLKRVDAVHEFGGNFMDAMTNPANWDPLGKSYDLYQKLIGKPFERFVNEPIDEQKERWDKAVEARKTRSFIDRSPPRERTKRTSTVTPLPSPGTAGATPETDEMYRERNRGIRPWSTPHPGHITTTLPPKPGAPTTAAPGAAKPAVTATPGPAPLETKDPENEYEQMLKDSLKTSKEEADKDKWFRLMQAGFGIAAQPGRNFLQNVALGSQEAIKGFGEDRVRSRKEKRELLKDLYGISDKQLDRQMRREEMNINQYFAKAQLDIARQKLALEGRPREFELASQQYDEAQRLLASPDEADKKRGKALMEKVSFLYGRAKTAGLSQDKMFEAYQKHIADGLTPQEAYRRVMEGAMLVGGGGFSLPSDVTVKKTK